MPTQTEDDQKNVGQQHSDDLFESQAQRGLSDIPTLSQEEADARKAKIQENLSGMEAPQRARALRRLEQQAAGRTNSPTAAPDDTAADTARQQEASGGWRNNLRGKNDQGKNKGSFVKRRAKRWLTGLAITAVMSIAGGIVAVMPHQLDILQQQMERKFMGRIEDYVGKRTEIMFFRYLSIYVFGNTAGIKSCQTAGEISFTVHSNCFYRSNRDDYPKTKLGQMFKGWKDRRIEAAALSGVDLHFAPNGLRANGTRGPTWLVTLASGEVPIDPSNPDLGMRRAFETVDVTDSSRKAKTELYKRIMQSLREETRSNVITRLLASIHLKNKYGLTRCLFYCDLRDRIDEKKVNIRDAWRGFLSDRIVGGINARAGLFMACMFQGGRSCAEDNEEFRGKYEETIAKLKGKFGSQKIEDILKLAAEYGKFRAEGGNLTKFIINTIFQKLADKIAAAGGGSFINAIPIVGQVIYAIIVGYKAFTVVLLIYNIYSFINSPAAQYASTAIKAAAYTGAYQTLATANDESRAAPGSIFSGGIRGVESESVRGLQKSFLYGAEFADPQGFNNFGAIFSKAAYAADAAEYPYKCDDDGTVIEKNQVLCPNWRFDYPNPTKQLANSLPFSSYASHLTDSDVATEIQDAANTVVDTIDKPFDAVSAAAFDHAPEDVKKWLRDKLGPLATKLSNYLFAVPFSDIADIHGAQLYDAWRLGVDWTVNDIIRGGLEKGVNGAEQQFGLGGRVATDKEVAELDSQFNKQQAEEFSKMSFFDKIFSTGTDRSFVSQLALAAPTNLNETIRVISPGTAFGLVDIMAKGRGAKAALAPGALHGGIPQYVFGNDELEKAPLRKTEDNTPCPVDRADGEGNLKNLADPGTTDKGLGRAEYTTTNMCLLDQYTIKVNSASDNDEPLDPELASASFSSTSANDPNGGVSTGSFGWPIAESDFAGTSSCYGPRNGPISNFHHGIDLLGKKGDGKTELLAADGGEVVRVAYQASGAGYYVFIKHANNFFTMYAHMPSFAAIRVKVGDKVSKGQVIGLEGSTGDATGPHLHFSIEKGAASEKNSINPLIELKKAMPPGSNYAKNNKCPIP